MSDWLVYTAVIVGIGITVWAVNRLFDYANEWEAWKEEKSD